MFLDYSDRMNRIAKSAGMFDFTRFRPLYPTKKAFNKYITVLDQYFEVRKLPIKLIVGDEKSIGYVIKMCPSLEGVEICNLEEIKNKDLSGYKECTIFIVGKEVFDTLQLETELYNRSPKCRVCSIYEYLEYNNLQVRYAFWNNKQSFVEKMRSFFKYMMSYKALNKLLNMPVQKLRPNTNLVIYLPSFLYRETIFCANQAFKSGYLEEEERQISLKKLMGFCVLEKDILGLKKYINIYADEYDKSFRRYIEEINLLISEMKERIAQRKHRDVVVNWVDSISNKRLKTEMPFLYRMSMDEGSMKSEYAYTCMPWTTPTMKTIMTGKDPIEGRLYDYKMLNDEMELLRQIKNNGYQFLYFGNAFWQKKIIPKKYQGFSPDCMRTYISTEYLWNAANRLATENDTPYFVLIHGLYETHDPYFCPDSNKLSMVTSSIEEEEKEISSKWMDKQYEFYMDLIGEKSLQIYLGDHGDHEKYVYAYQNERLNIMFFLKNSPKKLDFSRGLFSLKKFPQLINYLMGWEDVNEEELFSEYAVSNNYDSYNEKAVADIIRNVASLKDKRAWMQVKTIRNKNYAYVLYFDGEEIFYDLKDESENLIDQSEYADIIKNMREVMGKEFIDIYKEDFFVHSRKLYEAYENLGQD